MGEPRVTDPRWRKSGRSTGTDTCVELNGDLDAVRDSKNPAGPTLPVTSLAAFVADVKAGRFDR